MACPGTSSIIGYFHRHRPEGRHWFRTLLAPLLAGVVLALYLRARSPERYRTIGHIIYEDTTERPGSGSGADVHGNHAIKSTEPSKGA